MEKQAASEQHQQPRITFPIPPDKVTEVFNSLDTNGDGVLSLSEISQLFRLVRVPPPSRKNLKNFFNALDANHDGVIQLEEFQQYISQRQQLLLRIFTDVCEMHMISESSKALNLAAARHKQQHQQQQQQQQRQNFSQPGSATNVVMSFLSSRLSAATQQQQPSPPLATETSQQPPPCSTSLAELQTKILFAPAAAATPVSDLAVDRLYFTSRTFRHAAHAAGVEVCDADVKNAMAHFDFNSDGKVTFDEFVEALLLVPDVNPHAIFDNFRFCSHADPDSIFGFRPPEVRPSIEKEIEAAAKLLEAEEALTLTTSDVAGGEYDEEFMKWLDGQSTAGGSSAEREALLRHLQLVRREQLRAEAAARAAHDAMMRAVAKKVICGAAAGMLSRTLTAPLDLVRIHMMVSSTKISSLDVLRQAVQGPRGILNLWNGNGVNCAKSVPELGLKLMLYDNVSTLLAGGENKESITVQQRLIAGGIAGAVAQFSTYPLDVARVRQICAATGNGFGADGSACAHPRFSSISACIIDIVKRNGPRALFAGLMPSTLGIIPYSSIDLAMNDALKQVAADFLRRREEAADNDDSNNTANTSTSRNSRNDLAIPILLSCGMASSCTASLLTFPVNVIRTIAQSSGLSSTVVAQNLWRSDGLRGFYRGLAPSLLKVMPSTAISYAAFAKFEQLWDRVC